MRCLPTIRERFVEIGAEAQREQLTYLGFLAELVMAECDDRDKRRAARRIHDAALPRPKRVEEFDFDANKSINPAQSSSSSPPAPGSRRGSRSA